MNDIELHIKHYLDYCSLQKRLDAKTIKAYRIDLTQFTSYITETQLPDITPTTLEQYISHLHQTYQPKTVKRKIASLKAMFHYFEYRELTPRTRLARYRSNSGNPSSCLKRSPCKQWNAC